MKKTNLIIILLIIVLIGSVMAETTMNFVTIGQGDRRWCKLHGVCTFDTITTEAIITGNLSVIGEVFNVTMNLVTWNITESFNVGGNLIAKNITADNAEFSNLTTTGRIGIGTTNPLGKLAIQDNTASNVSILFRSDDTSLSTPSDYSSGKIISGFTSGAWTDSYIGLDAVTGADTYLRVLTVTGDGRVGIGTTTPESLLNLADTGSVELILHADTDNANEADVPTISFRRDGTVDALQIGVEGTAGTTFTNSLANTPYIYSVSDAYGIQFATDDELVMTVKTGKDVRIEDCLEVVNEIRVGTDGSATDPSFTWTDDMNTGMFRAGTDILGFTTAGSEAMRIDASGNVGIGTTSPGRNLEIVESSAYAGITLNNTGAGGESFSLLVGNTAQDMAGKFGIYDDGENWRFIIDTNGKVGIGTNNPTNTLHLNYTFSHGIKIESEAAYATSVHFTDGIDDFSVGLRSSTDNFVISESTRVTDTERFVIAKTSGNVGIGTTTPTHKLEVAGSMNVSFLNISNDLYVFGKINQLDNDTIVRSHNTSFVTDNEADTLDTVCDRGSTTDQDITTTGTVQAEQLNSTDDITMQGHLLTLGDDSANDVVISFKGSSYDGTLTWDESANRFVFNVPFRNSVAGADYSASKITYAGVFHIDAGLQLNNFVLDQGYGGTIYGYFQIDDQTSSNRDVGCFTEE